MPSRRRLPTDLGIIRSRTGTGRNVRPEVRPAGREMLPRSSGFDRTGHLAVDPRVRGPDCPAPAPSDSQKRRISDKVEEIGEPASPIVGCPLVQLGRIRIPGSALTRRPRCAGIHRRPPAPHSPALRDRCRLRPVDRLSGLRLLRTRPIRSIDRRRPARVRPTMSHGREPLDGSPVHLTTDRRGGAQLFPCSPGHGYAAGFLRGSDRSGWTCRPETPPAIPALIDCCPPRSTRFEPYLA